MNGFLRALFTVVSAVFVFVSSASADFIVSLDSATPQTQSVTAAVDEVVTLGSFRFTSVSTDDTVTNVAFDLSNFGGGAVNYYELRNASNDLVIATSEIASEIDFSSLDVGVPANTVTTLRLDAVLGTYSGQSFPNSVSITPSIPVNGVSYLDWQQALNYAPNQVISANTTTITAPVPEPPAFALLAAFVASLGVAVWLRRR